MKRIRNIVFLFLGFILFLNILVIVLLNIPVVQQKVLGIVITKLKQKTGHDISVGSISLNFFRGVVLDDVYLADERGDTLLYVGTLSANTSVLRVYRDNTLRIDDVLLENFKIFLSKDSTESPLNLQSFIKAFASEDSVKKDKTPSTFDLIIDNIELRNGSFRYDVFSKPESPGLFNASHIHTADINARLSLGSIHPEKFEAEIVRLAATEQSGLDLRDLEVKVVCEGTVIRLSDFLLNLPDSRLRLSDVSLDYSNVSTSDSLFMTHAVYNIRIEPSEIVPSDLKAFLPSLSDLSNPLRVRGLLSDTIPSLNLSEVSLSYGENTDIVFDFFMENWNDYRKSKYRLDISSLDIDSEGIRRIIKIASSEARLPEMIDHFGTLRMRMHAFGTLEDIRVNAFLKSAPGEMDFFGNIGYRISDSRFTADMQVETATFALNQVMDTSLHLGNIALQLHSDILISKEEMKIDVSGIIPRFTYQDYTYRQIGLEGSYGTKEADMRLALNDSNISLQLDGKMLRPENALPEYELQMRVKNFQPYDLHLTNELKDVRVAANVDLKLKGDNPENIIGSVRLDSIDFIADSVDLHVDSLFLAVTDEGNGRKRVYLGSPYLKAELNGTYNLSTIVSASRNILHPYLPTFFKHTDFPENTIQNNFSYTIELERTENLSRIFHLPVTLHDYSKISGAFRYDSGELELNAMFPAFSYGTVSFKGTSFSLMKRDSMYVFDVRSMLEGENSPLNLLLHTEIERNVVLANLHYDNGLSKFLLKGDIRTLFTFNKESPDSILVVSANFLPSDLTANNLTVEFEPAVVVMKQGNISIRNFGLIENNKRFLGIEGVLSDSETDSLHVSFNEASIANLLGGLNLSDIPVNGYLDGTIHFSGLFGHPRFYTNAFHINDITYLNDTLGTLVLNSFWNEPQKGMNIGILLSRDGEDLSSADGFISPIRDLIRFDLNLDPLPLGLAQSFLKGVVHDLSGYCGADLRARGKLSAPDIIGYIYIKDAFATVDYTNVSYHFSDTIRFTPTKMEIKNLQFYDNKNHRANLNCTVRHKNFSDINYSASIRMNDFMLLNNPTKKDSLLYGVFYANGTLFVNGNLENATVGGNLKNGENTKVMVRLPETVTQARTYSNIVYVSNNCLSESQDNQLVRELIENAFLIKAKIAVEITDQALFGAIINSSTGDELTVRGNGNINVNYDSEASSVKLFGQYIIENGHLKMKLSQLPTKLFDIQQGSKVILKGDPMASSFDISAVYKVRADLNTLDASFSSLGLSTTRVPVNCILQIEGDLKKFNLAYDISLPESSEEINRNVNSIINTDDLRIKEFAYLIGFGMFFPPNSQSSDANNNILTSLASSSLSSALNSALSGVLGNKWTVGTDFSSSQDNFSDLEMNVSLSTQFFNDRLILNTNLGYKNDVAGTEESPLIGDFDVEYKLTKSGMFRIKAYNHANNEIFRSSANIQGVGIVFTKDGKRFRDLFRFNTGKKEVKKENEKKPDSQKEE